MATFNRHRLIPALAVVDSRNIYHQAETILGRKLLPSVPGVINALERYGFDALEVHVGLALPRRRDTQDLYYILAENEPYMRAVEQHPRGHVLLGEVHAKNGGADTEEKMVDVHCAVDIVRAVASISEGKSQFEAIVVLSQDIDLMPAYDYAESAGVPLYVAAANVIQHRAQSHLLLGECAFRQMCDPGLLSGHVLRAAIARIVTNPSAGDWTAGRYKKARGGTALERNGSGIIGIGDSARRGTWVEGNVYQVHPVGLNWGSERQFRFPAVQCSQAAGPMRCRLQEARVVTRRTPLNIEVELSDGSRKQTFCPIGYVVSGMRVLVEIEPAGNIRYVGPLETCLAPASDLKDYIERGVPFVSRVLAVQSPAFALGTGPGPGVRVGLVTLPRTPVTTGARVACAIVDVTKKGPTAQIISSILP